MKYYLFFHYNNNNPKNENNNFRKYWEAEKSWWKDQTYIAEQCSENPRNSLSSHVMMELTFRESVTAQHSGRHLLTQSMR
jgi:hypothetical protein